MKRIVNDSDFGYSEIRNFNEEVMIPMKSATAEIKSRGQLTIPKKIREMVHLEEGQTVSIIPIGDSVIVSPKRLGGAYSE